MVALSDNLAPGLLTSLNTGAYAATGGTGERVLIDYKDAIKDYKVTDLAAMSMFTEPMTTETGGDIDITFAKPSMGMEEINEGNTPKYQHTNLRSERVSVGEWGLALGVTRRMIEDSRFNEVEMALNEARRAVDRHMTKHVVYALLGILDSGFGTGVDGASIVAATTEANIVDFSDNIYGGFLGKDSEINVGRNYSYGLTASGTLQTSHYMTSASGATAGTISLGDLTDSMELIGGHGFNANMLMISPAHYKTLLNLADFTAAVNSTASIYGGPHVVEEVSSFRNTFATAAIGNIFGLTVVVNAWCPPDRIFMWDSSVKPMSYVERRPLTVEEANPGFGIVGSYMSMRYGLKVTSPMSGVVIINAQRYSLNQQGLRERAPNRSHFSFQS